MSGRKGRSGGHNKLSFAEHVLKGTVNTTRHVPKPGPMGARALAAPPVPVELTAGLSGRGLDFVRECWTTYAGWAPHTRALLREAGTLLDQLDRVRNTPEERGAQRMLVAVIAALRLEP